MTLTIELPDELERRLRAMPESERHRFTIAALSDWLAALEGKSETQGGPHDDLRAADRPLRPWSWSRWAEALPTGTRAGKSMAMRSSPSYGHP